MPTRSPRAELGLTFVSYHQPHSLCPQHRRFSNLASSTLLHTQGCYVVHGPQADKRKSQVPHLTPYLILLQDCRCQDKRFTETQLLIGGRKSPPVLALKIRSPWGPQTGSPSISGRRPPLLTFSAHQGLRLGWKPRANHERP